MNRIQAPVQGNKNTYEDNSVAGANMDEGAGRKELEAHWVRVCDRLRKEIGDKAFKTWFGEVELGELKAGKLRLYAPTRFVRDWVGRHYGDRVLAYWQSVNTEVKNVEVNLVPPPAPRRPNDIIAVPPVPSSQSYQPPMPRMGPAIGRGNEELTQGPEARYTFANFVVGKPNEFAYACARRVAEKPASPGFNPLFLYGGVGLGKTHLMHAVAWAIRGGEPPRNVAYMSAEKFMYRFISALRSQSTMEFKESLRSVDVLMVDDLQFLIGKDNTQEEFFHTFNALIDAGKQIIISADKSPSDLNGLEDRLRTRLGCGMVADIHATTFELRLSILQAKANAAGVAVPKNVHEFLAHKITSNVRELEGALNRLIAHANLFGRAITLESAQDVLHDLLRAHDRRVTIEEIQRKVAEHYNIRLTDMSSARRARNVARPRQVAMYLAKQLTSRSLPEIGRRFGNRDHTTVMHAVSRISELMQADSAFAEDVELLRRMLET